MTTPMFVAACLTVATLATLTIAPFVAALYAIAGMIA